MSSCTQHLLSVSLLFPYFSTLILVTQPAQGLFGATPSAQVSQAHPIRLLLMSSNAPPSLLLAFPSMHLLLTSAPLASRAAALFLLANYLFYPTTSSSRVGHMPMLVSRFSPNEPVRSSSLVLHLFRLSFHFVLLIRCFFHCPAGPHALLSVVVPHSCLEITPYALAIMLYMFIVILRRSCRCALVYHSLSSILLLSDILFV